MSKNLFLELVERLVLGENLSRSEWVELLSVSDAGARSLVAERARGIAREIFGTGVFVRGLIEISSYCKNNCFYCGLRAANRAAARYRLSHDEVLSCCREGDKLGFNTFVLQGGEDVTQDDAFVENLVAAIHREFPHKAITLSVGERSKDAYAAFRAAGAARYLLRHETACDEHYAALHPRAMSGAARRASLFALKELGYQVGSGMMIGSPGQALSNLADDFVFLQKLEPQMIGVGPFIPAAGTPFAASPAGSAELTLYVISLLRLRFSHALIPSTTALATLLPDGMERGILSGANVVMPNLSPADVRAKYSIYNNKKSSGSESAQQLAQLEQRLQSIGYHIDYNRGDYNAPQKVC